MSKEASQEEGMTSGVRQGPVPIELSCVEIVEVPGGVRAVRRIRLTRPSEHYDWLRPPSQIHYLKDEDGEFLPGYRELFDSGEWVDTHDGGWLVRGRRLDDDEVRDRCGPVWSDEEIDEWNRLALAPKGQKEN